MIIFVSARCSYLSARHPNIPSDILRYISRSFPITVLQVSLQVNVHCGTTSSHYKQHRPSLHDAIHGFHSSPYPFLFLLRFPPLSGAVVISPPSPLPGSQCSSLHIDAVSHSPPAIHYHPIDPALSFHPYPCCFPIRSLRFFFTLCNTYMFRYRQYLFFQFFTMH